MIDLVLNCGCFVYIGAWIPFDHFTIPELGIAPGKLVLLAVGILFLRRIPAILILYKWIPEITSWREALFSGHFGTLPAFLSISASCSSLSFRSCGFSAYFLRYVVLTTVPHLDGGWRGVYLYASYP